MPNSEVAMSLDDCVAEVLSILTGLDLDYNPQLDRYQTITRTLNRALRANATDREWSYYSSTEDIGAARSGQQSVELRASLRPRIINDDAVRLVNSNGVPVVWAYFLPRDALSKYPGRRGLWVSSTRQSLLFSRPFAIGEDGLRIQVPVMREPKMFRLPDQPTDPSQPLVPVPDAIRNQLIDFDYPDLIIMRAAYMYAQTDPVMQPRAQTLEGEYKDIFYNLNERDDRNTDSPYLNEFDLGISADIGGYSFTDHNHPRADDRGL